MFPIFSAVLLKKLDIFFSTLWNRRRWRGRSVLAVSFLNVRAHRLETLALIDHFHHVTRDTDADASGQAHSIEDKILGSRAVLDIARRIARVAL
ncbi:MAG: hypothetical protein WD688_08370 [Candidatus Binatia bacterium]